MMRIRIEREADQTRLFVSGRVDLASALDLELEIDQQIDAGQLHLVLELSELEYIGSAAVHVILRAARRLRPRGGQLALVDPQDFVWEVIEAAGIAGVTDRPPAQAA